MVDYSFSALIVPSIVVVVVAIVAAGQGSRRECLFVDDDEIGHTQASTGF